MASYSSPVIPPLNILLSYLNNGIQDEHGNFVSNMLSAENSPIVSGGGGSTKLFFSSLLACKSWNIVTELTAYIPGGR